MLSVLSTFDEESTHFLELQPTQNSPLTLFMCTSNSYTYCFFTKDSLSQKIENISVQAVMPTGHRFLRILPSGSRQRVPSDTGCLLRAK